MLADPPEVHPGAPRNVWSTDADCYDFLARLCSAGTRTLETGLGVSTILFGLLGTDHVCVVPSEEEVRRCKKYFDDRAISRASVRFVVAPSDKALPELGLTNLDVVFIDGSHAYPQPVIDWYYGAGGLRRGGTVIFDDVQLPHVHQGVVSFLESDPRWERLERTAKWAAFRRLGEGSLNEEWTSQPFFGAPSGMQRIQRRAQALPKALLKRTGRRLRRAVRRSGELGPQGVNT